MDLTDTLFSTLFFSGGLSGRIGRVTVDPATASRRPAAMKDQPLLRDAGPALVSAGLALLVYAVTLGGTFIYDDVFIVQQDPRVANPKLWGQFWSQGYFAEAIDHLYRPLVSMTYAVQWWLHGDRAWAFHAVNWLLHAGVAAALAELVRRSLGGTDLARRSAYLAGALFAVHPVHVEAVANIVGRAELMCALAVLGGLVVFARRPLTSGRVIALFACLAGAVLSKEQGILFPLLLLIYGLCLWRFAPPGALLPAERQRLRWMIVLFTWCMSAYLIGREHFLKFEWDRSFLDWGLQPMVDTHGLDHWLMPLVLLGHYTQLLVLPIHLSIDYGADVIGSTVHGSDPYLWLGIVTVLSWGMLGVAALRRRDGYGLFCLLSLACTYGVVGNVLTLIGVNLAERLMYLPSAFFLMWVARPLARLPRPVLLPVAAALLLAGSLRSFTYARLWNDRLNFYVQSLAQQPRSTQLYLLATQEYRDRGDLPDAERVAVAGTTAFPRYWHVWTSRALVELAQGNYAQAKKSADTAFPLSPGPMVIAVESMVDTARAAHTRATTPATARAPAAAPASRPAAQ